LIFINSWINRKRLWVKHLMAKCVWQKVKINGAYYLRPFDNDSEDRLKDFKDFEPVTGDISGARNPRSLKQLRLYWAACMFFAETYGGEYRNKEIVDWRLRNALQFFDPEYTYVKEGVVQFKVRSISFKNLPHIEACGYFDLAFETMAGALGVTVEAFIDEVKQKMGRR